MAIFTATDVSNCYNETVMSYLNNGYILSPMTTGGSYSNTMCHTDLYNPNEKNKLIRVWLMDKTESVNDEDRFVETLTVCAKKYSFIYTVPMKSQTLWPDSDSAELVGKFYKFYLISDKKGRRTYTDNKEELRSFRKLNWERYKNKSVYSQSSRMVPIDKLTPKFVDGVMSRINSLRGFKRATASCITDVKIWKEDCGKMRALVRYSYKGKCDCIFLK